MGTVQDIVSKHDIQSAEGFRNAMTEMRSVPEGMLRFILAYETAGQRREWKIQHAIAKAEMDRRSFSEQKKLTKLSGLFGLLGIVVGAILQFLVSSLQTIAISLS